MAHSILVDGNEILQMNSIVSLFLSHQRSKNQMLNQILKL